MLRLLRELLRFTRMTAAAGWSYVGRVAVVLVLLSMVAPFVAFRLHDALIDETKSCVRSAQA